MKATDLYRHRSIFSQNVTEVCPAIGLVRLTVGQKGSDGAKVQYCITAIEVS